MAETECRLDCDWHDPLQVSRERLLSCGTVVKSTLHKARWGCHRRRDERGWTEWYRQKGETVRGRSWVWIHLTFFRYPEETLGWKAVAEVGLAAVHSVHP